MAFVKLIEPQGPGELSFIKSLLDGNDIEYYVQNEHFGSLYNTMGLPCTVMVEEWDFERARLLVSLLKSQPPRKQAG